MLPKHQLLGVYNLKLMRLYEYIAQRDGIKCTIVHSLDGYDEISLTSQFKVSSPEGEMLYNPEDLGWKRYSQESLFGGNTVQEASVIFDNVLSGKATESQLNCVIANSAFAIKTLDPELTLTEAVTQATESISSGMALKAFRKFVDLNK